MKIGILEERFLDHTVELDVIKEAGFEPVEIPADAAERSREMLGDLSGLLVNLTPVTAELLAQMPSLKVVSRYGVGADSVDIGAARQQGVTVLVQPGVSTEEVADHALALIMACTRGIVDRDRAVRNGGWNVEPPERLRRIGGRTVGIIGFGRIGKAVAKRLTGFAPKRIVVSDPLLGPQLIRDSGGEPLALADLLSVSDVVTLHLPLTEKTARIIDAQALGRMKSGAFLINTSRGGLVDTEAVIDALDRGDLAGFAADSFEQEPPDDVEPLTRHKRVVMTDHCAWASEQSVSALKRATAVSACRYLAGERSGLHPAPGSTL